ncbi:acetoacetyl-CoA synthetase [Mycobacterium mantenii]|uniref:Acetoacetyl-CoA synthetase n=1 Tax=Mycobacterium mantenii TaxID=560555 RepID=A0ABN6A8K3_MYCNT|nr:acetoacetyl-CoA synthetase [Mycobacterium mantenii]
MWSPPADVLERSRVGHYLTFLRDQHGLAFDGYPELWRWSVDDLDAFWGTFAEWAGVRWHECPSEVLATRTMPGAQWFPRGTLSFAEHALARADDQPGAVAVVARSQTRDPVELTWAELQDAVARCRAGLRRLGVGRGDRVCAYAPNIPETLIAFLATASLGAIWASCAPEFGTRAVIDRFGQIEPKVLLAVDGYRYGQRCIDRRGEVAAIEATLPTLQHTIHLRYLDVGPDGWAGLLAEQEPMVYDPVPFDHPLCVLFSSGTTGLPKPIVHGHGGIVIEHLKTMALQHDLSPGDRFSWFTTTGWTMWNYLLGGLLVGATLVLFDGDPGYPDLSTLWRLAAETELDVFGVSAPFIMASRKAGVQPPAHRLRVLGSTGAPLPPDGFRWIREVLGAGVQPCSMSGGTDVAAAFVGSTPLLPVRAGEISCRMLGVAAEAFDPAGSPCPAGVQGELVITQPMPSMPVKFWGDLDGELLRAAYFSTYPGVWRHGDWITFTDDGASVLSGRSDATLNRGGVRLGTSDFYAVVEELPWVRDSLVVHLESDAGSLGTLALFVSTDEGSDLDDVRRGEIVTTLRSQLSPRHVPDLIERVPDIPRTLSGKKLEVPVKRILAGAAADAVASRSSLVEPDSLLWFEAYARRWAQGKGSITQSR